LLLILVILTIIGSKMTKIIVLSILQYSSVTNYGAAVEVDYIIFIEAFVIAFGELSPDIKNTMSRFG
jgi:hypothetical protein